MTQLFYPMVLKFSLGEKNNGDIWPPPNFSYSQISRRKSFSAYRMHFRVLVLIQGRTDAATLHGQLEIF